MTGYYDFLEILVFCGVPLVTLVSALLVSNKRERGKIIVAGIAGAVILGFAVLMAKAMLSANAAAALRNTQ